MALLGITVRIIGRRGGRPAVGRAAYRSGTALAMAAYRSAERFELPSEGRVFDYSNKLGVVYKEILVPAGAPDWARDRRLLWWAVEAVEKRKDAQLARELVITLPREVPFKLVLAALREWVRRDVVAFGMVADLCVHAYGTPLDPRKPEQDRRLAEILESHWPQYELPAGAALPHTLPHGPHSWRLADGRVLVYQPHAHVLLTTRTLGTEGFGLKQRGWNRMALLYWWRQTWEETYNALLEDAGLDERVTSKAKWKIAADAEREAGSAQKSPADHTSNQGWLPVEVDLGGGYYAALDGRGPVNGKDEDMTGWRWNERLRELHQRERNLEGGVKARLERALVRVRELQQQGVVFRRTDKGALGYEDPRGLVTAEDRRLWAGLHELILCQVEAERELQERANPDRRREEAMREIDRLIKAGVRFFRTEKGGLGYDDPHGVMTPEIWRGFSGLHETILAELERRKFEYFSKESAQHAEKHATRAKRYQAEAEAAKADAAVQRREKSALASELSTVVAFAEAELGSSASRPGTPLLARLKNAVTSLGKKARYQQRRADKAEAEASFLRHKLGDLVDWVIPKLPKLARAIRAFHQGVLAGVAAIRRGERPADAPLPAEERLGPVSNSAPRAADQGAGPALQGRVGQGTPASNPPISSPAAARPPQQGTPTLPPQRRPAPRRDFEREL